jgi:G3E family GTPase
LSQIPFFLITGFLGSGKTTFLKNILKHHQGKKVAIIQNEFAPSNVDGTDLKNEGGKFEILEINNGSVFCICLLNDFITSLKAFVDQHQPEMLFLEASGLSDPIAIAQLLDFEDLKKRLYLAKIWAIVDSQQFLKQQKLVTRLQHQVRVADVIIINKTDLSTETEIEKVTQEIIHLNPFGEIIQASFCKLDDKVLDFTNKSDAVAQKAKHQNNQFESCGRPDISVFVLKTTKTISRGNLELFIDNYSKKTIRMKGFAKLSDNHCMAIQSSFDRYELKFIEMYNGPTEIIAMGDELDVSEFSRRYRELAE